MNLQIRVNPLAGGRLLQDYLRGEPALGPYFFGRPFDADAYVRKAAAIDARFTPEARKTLASALRPTSARAAADVARVGSGEALAVTSGQQAGLFTGPLYTTHKILSTVRLARALEARLGRRVVPIFWIASDDHDWAEVDHAELLDAANELRRLTLPAEEAVSLPVGERHVRDSVRETLAELERTLPDTEFKAELIALAQQAYAPGSSVSGAFADMVADLFSEFDLLLVDPRHPAMKELARPVLQRELEQSSEHERALRANSDALDAAGYPVQVSILPGESNVFLETASGRERLVRDGPAWRAKGSGEAFSAAELSALLGSEPKRFSPNVLLRPVVESTAIPTLAYVGGPSEVAYWAQIGPLFRAHGLEMPLVFPRFRVTLVETKVQKVLDKYGLAPEDFHHPVQEIASRVVREEMPDAAKQALESLRREWSGGFEALLGAVQTIDPTLKGPLQSARNSGFQQLAEAEKKIAQATKRQNATVVEQVEKAAANLFPRGAPQERVLNVLQYLARYGRGLLSAILERMEVTFAESSDASRGA